MPKKKQNKLAYIMAVVIIILLIILFIGYKYPNSSLKENEQESGKFLESLIGEDTSCDYNNGENCQNNPLKCVCKNSQICSPDRANSDNLGCYTIVCGDGYRDREETSESCCIDVGCLGDLVCDANLNQCVKPECPFDCCINDFEYQDKSCPEYYTCNSQEHSCEPEDSDNDAFPDYLEIETGTEAP